MSRKRPHHRRRRRKTLLGTCQVCGRTVVIVTGVTPRAIRFHGYHMEQTVRAPCLGAEHPPLEDSRDQTERVLGYVRHELTTARERRAAILRGEGPAGPPPGVSGLLNRFSDAPAPPDEAAAQARRAAQVREIDRTIERLDARVTFLTRLLATAAAGIVIRTRAPAPRIGDLFRRNRDGVLYRVAEYVPAPPRLTGPRGRSGTYLCENPAGLQVRMTSNEVARALREQGGSLPKTPS